MCFILYSVKFVFCFICYIVIICVWTCDVIWGIKVVIVMYDTVYFIVQSNVTRTQSSVQ